MKFTDAAISHAAALPADPLLAHAVAREEAVARYPRPSVERGERYSAMGVYR